MPMRGSVTFDKPRQQASGSKPEGTEVSRPRRDTTFARHSLLRGGVALRPPSLPRPAVARAFHAIKWAVQRARYMTLETISPMGHDLTLTLPTAAA
jgi:hypothetical protein